MSEHSQIVQYSTSDPMQNQFLCQEHFQWLKLLNLFGVVFSGATVA
jgi:hypothetical protein